MSKQFIRHVLAAREVVDAPEWVQLIPPGRIEPIGKKPFVVDAEARRTIMSAWAARANDAVLDYEHQTLAGSEAPAAGWITELADRGDGVEGGIWGKVNWTDRAKEYLGKREYRYLSPVVLIENATRRAVEFLNAALTNMPAIDGMVPVVNKDGAGAPTEDEEVEDMKWLKDLLGLPETATETEMQTAVEALKVPKLPGKVAKALGLDDGASADRAEGAILALKANTGGPTRVEFEALKKDLAERDAEGAVAEALKAGKVTPANKGWAVSYAKENPEGFAEYCKSAVPVVPTGELGGGSGPAGGGGSLSQEAIAVCKAFGNKLEDVQVTMKSLGKED